MHAMSRQGQGLRRYSSAAMPTAVGDLTLVVYRVGDDVGTQPEEHMAIIAGPLAKLADGGEVLARVHSECWTGETLGSLKCDCRAQLDAALAAIAHAGSGVVVYLRQ